MKSTLNQTFSDGERRHCPNGGRGPISAWNERFGGAAVVTGASSGIGEAFARALAARGMNLILVAREGERLEVLARSLEVEHHIRAIPMAVDLADPNVAQTVSAGAKAAGLTVGLLVNNAGYGLFGNFTGQDPAEQAGMIDVNCRAPVALARKFAPGMVARGRGGIIFVASTAAYQPTPYFSVYAATKVFDLFMGEALWAELEPHGVEVLALSPGHVPTGFQARSGDPMTNPPGGVSRPDEIVATALATLGRKPSVISGLRNGAVAALVRLLPRTMVMKATMRYFKSLKPRGQTIVAGATMKRPTFSGDGRFARSVVRLLAAFLAVSFIDLVVCSLVTHKLRCWFPAWIDAHWDTRPDSWVTYSQSYMAGIFFIPVLAAAVVREFVPKAAAGRRTAIVAGTLAVFAFIAWWKGGLMLKYHREWEAVAWLVLTAITWGLIRLGEELPARMTQVSPRHLATWLARGVSILILMMAVADPVLCVGVQGLPWSKGIWIEIGFLSPAGIALWAVAHRLSIKDPTD
jgi:short-subunit dehydrogenase